LIVKNSLYCCYGVFKVRASSRSPNERTPATICGRSLKTQQRNAPRAPLKTTQSRSTLI
jgi:hypothetical protein